MAAIHKLSETFIRKVTKDGCYGDGGGLWLQVSNGGDGKSWLFKYTDRRTRKPTNMGLGSLNTVNLSEARDKALACRKLLDGGKDPRAERDAAKLESDIRAGEAKTVRQAWEEFYDAKVKPLGRHSRKNYPRLMERHVLKVIGDMPIAKVTRNHVLDVVGLRRLWETRHKSGVTLLSILTRMFSLAIERGYCGHPKPPNPLDWEGLKHVLPDPKRVHKVKHRASLRYQDTPRFMQALRRYKDRSVRNKGHPTRALWLEFVVLSGVRLSEARLATWSEMQGLDGLYPVWVVPVDHHKIGNSGHTDEPHIIPLTKPMVAVLHEMRRRHGSNPNALVFPSPYGLKHGKPRPFDVGSANTFIKGCLQWDMHVTAHGFRSTFTDWARAQSRGWHDLIEEQVGHVRGAKVQRAYRHDPLTEQRRPMMELWGEFCAMPPPAADNVVTLNRKEAAA
jgi:integrase